MGLCKNCEHWNKSTDYGRGVTNEGDCSKLPNNKLMVNVSYGWNGGYIENIETEEDFGCNLFNKKAFAQKAKS